MITEESARKEVEDRIYADLRRLNKTALIELLDNASEGKYEGKKIRLRKRTVDPFLFGLIVIFLRNRGVVVEDLTAQTSRS